MDDDEKVRRNLMISSFAVLLFFWLNLPEGAIVKRILGDDYETSISPMKLWIAIAAVLIYQIVRFTASLLESDTYALMRDKFSRARHKEIQRWIARKVSKNHQGKIIEFLGEVTSPNLIIPSDEKVILDWPSAKVSGISEYKSLSVWSGYVRILDKNHDNYNSQLSANYEIKMSQRLSIELPAVVVLAKTGYLPEVGVPICCSYAALVCTAYQIGTLI